MTIAPTEIVEIYARSRKSGEVTIKQMPFRDWQKAKRNEAFEYFCYKIPKV